MASRPLPPDGPPRPRRSLTANSDVVGLNSEEDGPAWNDSRPRHPSWGDSGAEFRPRLVPVERPTAGVTGRRGQPVRTAKRSSPGVRRRRLQVVGAITAVALLWAGWSYYRALTGPGNDALAIRSTEWLKNHGMGWAVNDVERWWYTHHKPRVGGAPSGALAQAVHNGAGTTPTTAAPAGPLHLPAPAAIAPIAPGVLTGEGDWRPLGRSVDGVSAMYAAYLRPDPVHTSLVTGVAWIDPTLVRLAGYAGVVEPGGGPWTNQAPIAAGLRPQLLAAFNSGFKMRDSRGGFYADGRTVRTLTTGAATLAISPDGTPSLGMWGRDLEMGPSVAFARQNLSLIVDGGQAVPGLAGNSAAWGRTVGNTVLVWRSGLGITPNGALVYAGGNDLTVASLANVLVHAGAVRAMELDINSAWVDFFSYTPGASGDLRVAKLLPDMRPSTSNYLTASSRDFVAAFARY